MVRKRHCLCIVFAMLIVLFSGCSPLSQCQYPSDGIWYCEDLDMYLDMKTSEGYILRTGEQEPVIVNIDFGNSLHICYCESEWDEAYETCDVLNATFKYHDGIFELHDTVTGETYRFSEVQ